MSYIGNQITGFLGTGSLTVTTSTVAVEGDALFSADGNVVLGDASGDTITINAATASIPNNLNIDSNTLFIDAANNRIGIGTSSPSELLHVTGASTAKVQISSTATTGISGIHFGDPDDVNSGRVQYEHTTDHMALYTNNAERMRIDSSGNLLVSKTSSDTNTAGVEARSNGQLVATLDGGTALIANRKTSDGDVVKIMKDGSTVGVIGTQNWGIGTSSPTGVLTIQKDQAGSSTSGTGTTLTFNGNAGAGNPWEIFRENGASGDLAIAQDVSGTRSEAMRIKRTNNYVGIGTSSPDRLLHLASSAAIVCIEDTAGATDDKRAQIQVDNGQFEINSRNDDNSSRIDNIFVADLGTGNIGIGTNSPSSNAIVKFIEIEDSTSAGLVLDAARVFSIYSSTSSTLAFRDETASTNRMLIDSSGNVLIGTDSGDAFNSDSSLRLQNGGNNYVQIKSPTTNQVGILMGDTADDFAGGMIYSNSGDYLRFDSDNAERLRITGAQFMFGQTDSSPVAVISATGGDAIGINSSDGYVSIKRNAGAGLYINKTDSAAGELIQFRTNGTKTGVIGLVGTNVFISDNAAAGLRFDGSGTVNILPCNSSGTSSDNAIDLGASSTRFKDLFLSGGLYVGGTGSANYFDDYEEGTWTPGIDGVSYATADGHYIKIGNKVHCIGVMFNASSTVTSANALFTGLPFAVASDDLSGTSLEGSGFFQYWANVGVGASGITLTPIQNTTTCNVYYAPASGVASGATISRANRQQFDASNVSLRFNLTYFTD